MKKYCLLLLYCHLTIVCAQDIEVKKFGLLEKDQTAVTSPRKDINGNACGLVKVALKEAGAEFEGNVMGNVEFTGSEYLVYLPNGTKRLGIKHPDYLPTTIVFSDYGTKRVVSSTTYELKVKTNKKKAKVDDSKKGIAVFNIKPSNAMLMIDGQIADGSGGAYTLSLPYGIHYYTVKLKDFSLNNQAVHVDKNAKTINVDLTEFFAKVDVSCQTEDAEISVNGEQKGIGKWSSMVTPGKYTIEASKDGCHSQTRQIELRDNDTLAVDFTALKTITGSLRVDYEPVGSDVLLNGKKVGVTPLELKELPVGDYQLEVWKEYYVKEFFNVKIAEDQEWKEKGELKLTQFAELYLAAQDESSESWDESVERLAEYYRFGAACGPRWSSISCDNDSVVPPLNPVEAIKLYRRIGRLEIGLDIAEEELLSDPDDAKISFFLAKKAYEDIWSEDKHWDLSDSEWRNIPFATLAWHYFYGIGCEKDIIKAKQFMRWACREDGTYGCPAYTKLVREMGMDQELKYVKTKNMDRQYE